MKYKLVYITVRNFEYSLRIEERIPLWNRFFFSTKPKTYVIDGDGHGYWKQRVYSPQLPNDLIEFADEAVYQYEHSIRFRQ
jgi:hypothetical protein